MAIYLPGMLPKTPLRIAAEKILKMSGWTFPEGEMFPTERCVMVMAPHTHIIDFFIVPLNWARLHCPHFYFMTKGEVFVGPIGWVLRAMGVIPIDRSKTNNLTESMVAEFNKRDKLVLGIPPEGTRAKKKYWKSGFYYIAKEAGVPILPSMLDFKNKRLYLGTPIDSSLSKKAIMDELRRQYANTNGLSPENYTTPRLENEDED
jgi:1-acyl-sn-glycerol-3-phosphate acyltransferase